jgi:ABC-type multidrug transport system ATPase subunit
VLTGERGRRPRLACALISSPRLLVLEEPFEAVDPVPGEGIRSIRRNYARGDGTAVMSSHVMELVESLCDELAVVAQGRVWWLGPSTRSVRAQRCSSGSSIWWILPVPGTAAIAVGLALAGRYRLGWPAA